MRAALCFLLAALLFSAPASADQQKLKTAIFAGGCFWCVESNFEAVPGVVSATSGYTGGTVKNASYEQVSGGGTGHKESVQVIYDAQVTSYEKLLDVFWRSIDPLDPAGQFCDKGEQYQSAIFYGTEEEKTLAEKAKGEVEKELGKTAATQILPASGFYQAEEYHQDYYKKNPIRYNFYRNRCGRDERVREVWGDKAFTAHGN